jgi:transcriptional regulator with XRE-family HTH domain
MEERMERTQPAQQTKLAILVRERLSHMGIKQSEFCRITGFDQGLLSKIQASLITSLSLESVLRLALGLGVQPTQVFDSIGRLDLHDLVLKSYSTEL